MFCVWDFLLVCIILYLDVQRQGNSEVNYSSVTCCPINTVIKHYENSGETQENQMEKQRIMIM